MSYGIGFDGRNRDNERAWAAAIAAVCFIALLVAVMLAIGGVGVRGLINACKPAPVYATPVCETCGQALDGRHVECKAEGGNAGNN